MFQIFQVSKYEFTSKNLRDLLKDDCEGGSFSRKNKYVPTYFFGDFEMIEKVKEPPILFLIFLKGGGFFYSVINRKILIKGKGGNFFKN